MSLRTFKQYNIVAGGTPQPLVGTTTTQAVGPNSNPDTIFTFTVADSSMFLKGDFSIIGKPSTGEERLQVFAVTDSTHITAKGILSNSYASGSYIRPSIPINSSYVQTKPGNAGTIYIGTRDNMVKATMQYCVEQLTAAASGQPIDFKDSRSGPYNFDNVAQLWVDGTTADSYTPTVGVV